MSEATKETSKDMKDAPKASEAPSSAVPKGEKKGGRGDRTDRRGGGRGRRERREKPKPEFDQELVDIARVTRIVAGGRRFRFRVTVVLGDRKGRVGFGIAKGTDVSLAAEKAAQRAKKSMIRVPLVGTSTIPHEVQVEFKGARLFLKPAPGGTGVIAGGSVRTILELAGVRNVHGKMHGSNNAFANVQATFKALRQLETPEMVAQRRGVEVMTVVKEPVEEESVQPEADTEKKESAAASATS